MQVIYTNANNELEMVYVELFGAIIIANLLEIALENTVNGLRHAISQGMRGFPSRFEVKMFLILLQECTLIQYIKNMPCSFEDIHETILKIIEKYLKQTL